MIWHLMICAHAHTHTHRAQYSWGVSQRQWEIQQVWWRWLALHVFQVLAAFQSLAPSNRDRKAGSVKETPGWPITSIRSTNLKKKKTELLMPGWWSISDRHSVSQSLKAPTSLRLILYIIRNAWLVSKVVQKVSPVMRNVRLELN